MEGLDLDRRCWREREEERRVAGTGWEWGGGDASFVPAVCTEAAARGKEELRGSPG